MNHVSEVNSILTRALVGHGVSLGREETEELAESGAKIPESEFMNT